MLLSAFNSKKYARGAWAVQIAMVFCCMGQPTSAQTSANAGAKTSTIVIDTDDACRLSVDGSDENLVTPDAVTKIKVRPGGHILKCVIEKAPELVWREVIETKSGEQAAALISLKALHIQHDQAAPQATAPVIPQRAAPAAPAVAAMKSEQASAPEKPRIEVQQFPEGLIAVLLGASWVREDVQFPGQTLLETHYTDRITFMSSDNGSIKARITKVTHSSTEDWESDFAMTFVPEAPNSLVQDGDPLCVQRLHHGRPDDKSPCSMWKNQMPHGLQLTLIDSSHLQVTSGQWFSGDKKHNTFARSLE